MRGSVTRLGVKPQVPGEFGLPKHPVERCQVTVAGLEGDYNGYRARTLQGDPAQAILLLTDEVLRQLNAEGWPVAPGDLGENLTLAGIGESSLGPGARLQAGAVTLEVTLACTPCTELYSLPYVGPERGPAFVRTLRGRRGWYARVLTPGLLRVDDAVEVATARSSA